jgi:eukaryotic-like serine/threonine-protein kinase
MEANVDEPSNDTCGDQAKPADADTLVELERESEPSPSVGDRLGRYHVLRRLGAGAMGTVVEAYDEMLDRRVAIKLLHERRRGRQERRLLREAQALARLSHPHVVQVYEVGEAAGQLFIAMELVVGQPFDQWQRQPRRWRETVQAYTQAARGLAAAHAQGLVHRDFKPSNCIIDEHGHVKVLDFGLARESSTRADSDSSVDRVSLAELVESSDHESRRALSDALTRTGAALGTPAYMAPEQLRGRDVGTAADQFNFCVSLYEALYGTRPFPHRSIGELVNAVLGGELQPPPKRHRAPRALWPILRRGLAHEPADRWPSMNAVIEQLERVLGQAFRRRGLVALGLLAASTAGMLWGRAESPAPCRGAEATLDETWNEARAQALGVALVATGVPYADGTRQRVIELLDAYAGDWVHRHTAACEATSVHEQQSAHVLDLRMRCLERSRVALSRTVDMLTTADVAVVERAVAMVTSLPKLARCDDVDALQAALPPPERAEDAAEVEAVRDQLGGVRLLLLADRAREAQATVERMIERAEALGYAPLQAEVRLVHGIVLVSAGRYPAAGAELTAAYRLAAELGHEEPASRAARELAAVHGQYLAEYPVGLAWGVTAESLARRVDLEGPQHANALRTIAIVQLLQGEIDAAAQGFEHSLRIWESRPDAGLDLARALGDLGNLRFDQGRLEEALAVYRRAHAIRLAELGEGHPELGLDAANMGHVRQAQGRFDESEADYRRAIALWSATRGPDHPSVALVLANLGAVLYEQGRHDEALAIHQRVLATRERSLGPAHPFVAQTLASIALSLRAKGELSQALEYGERALGVFEASNDPDVAKALYELGATELLLGHIDAAQAHHERELELARERFGEASPEYALAELGLAEVRWARGEHEPARALAQRALARVSGERPDAELRATIERWLGARSEP